MKPKRTFVTGASGCIGHYIAESLIQETDRELYLLVRNPDKLGFDWKARPGIHILQGDLREIEQFGDLLKTMDSAILAATAWGGTQEVFDVNVIKTIRLMNLLDPSKCEQVIYFSTASILGRNNQLLKEAGELGTDYIRSKYDCLNRLSKLAIAPQITTLFPTLVLGGEENKPYSHLSSGLPEVFKWLDLIRFFAVDGSFHFIHGRDIAQVVRHLLDCPPETPQRQFVLGNPQITVNEAIEQSCTYLNKKIYFRLPLYPWLAEFFIFLFRVQMAAWDRFCMRYRHFTYQNPINPATFNLPGYCANFADILKISGIARGS
jgi:nucleoside-diphosphate-sugar epimerase